MTSRGEFVISQGWGTASGLRALARIQVRQGGDTPQISGAPADIYIDVDASLVANDENASPVPVAQS